MEEQCHDAVEQYEECESSPPIRLNRRQERLGFCSYLYHLNLLSIPVTFGDRSFAVVRPRVWNSLPAHLRDEDITYNSFRRELKTFLF